jgi:hypothetical protein
MKTKTTELIIKELDTSYKPILTLNQILFEKGDLLTKRQLLILSNQLVTFLLRITYDNDKTPEYIKYLIDELLEEGFNS